MKPSLKRNEKHAEVWVLIDFICFYDKDVIKWAVICSFPEWEGQKLLYLVRTRITDC